MPDVPTNWYKLAFLTSILARVSESHYRSVPSLPENKSGHPLPSLSVIVPARNEADNLCRLLPSLMAMDYPGSWEVIVVDDNSADETVQIAEKNGAKVIQTCDRPPGWLGKPYACHRGAMAASGEWFLFTDADTVHHSRGPAAAVAYAGDHHLDGLSIFIKQSFQGLTDRIVLMAAFAGLFVGSDPAGKLFNGQYILLRRDVYEQSGGYAAVVGKHTLASQPLEDLAFGHHLRRCGYNLEVLRSDFAAEVRIYSDPRLLWHSLARLSAGSLRWLGAGSLITALFTFGAMIPIPILVAAFSLKRKRKWAIASWAAVALGFLPWRKHFSSDPQALALALLAPLGAIIVQAAAAWGLISRLIGRGFLWKGRKV